MKTFEKFNEEDNIFYKIKSGDYRDIYVKDKNDVLDMVKIFLDDNGLDYRNVRKIAETDFQISYEYIWDNMKLSVDVIKHKLLTKKEIENWKLKKDLDKFNI